jgi:choline dehydrogenase-like flavoprotein
MFTIRFATDVYRPDLGVTLRSDRDGWQADEPGVYTGGAWLFTIDLAPGPFTFKLLLDGTWMNGDNVTVDAVDGGVHEVAEFHQMFTPLAAVTTENGRVQTAFFVPDLDPDRVWDTIVVGSGMGGGVLADQLSDAGQDVLVLEAGSYLFPTHVANLPRRLRVGKFDKHVWGLYEDFSFPNYVNTPGSTFGGRQAFNLGGRSVFWGGLIPRMGLWELAAWPAAVRDYLTTTGYRLAEDAMNRSGPVRSTYQDQTKATLATLLPDFDHLDAPVAVQYRGYTPLSLSGGMFSTADLLSENRLVQGGPKTPTVNLNHAVQQVLVQGGRATGVTCWDLVAGRQRAYRAQTVVLSGGCLESAKIAIQSGITDPNQLIGKGVTDHPIWFTHFSLPKSSPHVQEAASAKVWSRHRQTSVTEHPYNVVVELGADFNQGRYVDPDNLQAHRQAKGDATLCEIVFLFNVGLVPTNSVEVVGPPFVPLQITMAQAPLPAGALEDARAVANTVLQGLGAQPIENENLDLVQAGLGGVAHEVGSLRMGTGRSGVVDEDLKFLDVDNLYACDNSALPSSPAANPSLTLVALALRLAEHLTR